MRRLRIDTLVRWTDVLLRNLLLALLFGLATTVQGGRVGMLVAVAVVWGGGLAACRIDGFRRVVLPGAKVLAWLQLTLVHPMTCGAVAFWVCDRLLGEPTGGVVPQLSSDLAGFVVTLLVSGQMLVAAVVCGTLIGQNDLRRRWRQADE